MHAGSLHFKAPFGKIMAVISSLTPLPWTIMSAGPTTGKASKDAGFHHLITNSRPWYKNPRQFPLSDLKKSPNSFWRIGIIVLNLFVSLLYANHNPSKVSLTVEPLADWSPRQRLDMTVCLSNIYTNRTSFLHLILQVVWWVRIKHIQKF